MASPENDTSPVRPLPTAENTSNVTIADARHSTPQMLNETLPNAAETVWQQLHFMNELIKREHFLRKVYAGTGASFTGADPGACS